MELVLRRRFLGEDYTIGRLYLSDFHLSAGATTTDSADATIRDSADALMDADGMTLIRNFEMEKFTTTNVTDEITMAELSSSNSSSNSNRVGDLVRALTEYGEYFCDTLEDKDRGLRDDMPLDEIRRIKVTHETAIPTGVYRVIVNVSPAKRRMLPRLLDVPGFSGILIHRGNTKNNSSGCILVGENKVKGKVINSALYEKRLVEILSEAQGRGEEIFIRVMNDKR